MVRTWDKFYHAIYDLLNGAWASICFQEPLLYIPWFTPLKLRNIYIDCFNACWCACWCHFPTVESTILSKSQKDELENRLIMSNPGWNQCERLFLECPVGVPNAIAHEFGTPHQDFIQIILSSMTWHRMELGRSARWGGHLTGFRLKVLWAQSNYIQLCRHMFKTW